MPAGCSKLLAVASYQVGEAAHLLGVSVDTVRRWVDGGKVVASRGGSGRRVIDGADLARLALELGSTPDPGRRARSSRNRFPGIVTRVLRDGVSAQVEIQAGPHRVVALITREATDELGLEPGVPAAAVVKATNVGVELTGDQ